MLPFLEFMKEFDYEYDFGGAPVIYSDLPDPPYNPLNRPEVNYKKFILSIIGLLLTILISFVCSKYFLGDIVSGACNLSIKASTLLIVLGFSVVYIRVILKRALIWLVHLYQHYASDEMRLKCVFEPSCSEYMILSIKKFGVVIGVFKGVRRLLRCHPPNGGHDEP